MNRALILLALIVGVGILAAAQEAVTLTTPITATTTTQRVTYLGLDLETNTIVVQVKNNAGGTVAVKTYDATTTPTGATLLSTLNTSNNSAGTSLIKRVYTRLITDGVIPAGTVSGTPQ